MQIRIKPVKGDEFTIADIDASTTLISELKKKVEESQGDAFAADRMKLILLGKIMDDKKTLGHYNYKEENFVVCMISKPKKVKAKPTPQVAAPKPANPAPTPAQATPAQTVPATPLQPATTTPAAPATAPAPGYVGPPIDEQSLGMLVGMGFAAEDARAALQAAFGNVERAVQFLTDPSSMPAPVVEPVAEAPAAGGPTMTLDQFRLTPMFQQLRQTVQQDPSQIQGILQNLQANNPALFDEVAGTEERIQAFVEMLTSDAAAPPAAGTQAAPPTGAAAGLPAGLPAGMPGLADMANLPPEMLEQARAMLANMTPEERQQLMQQMAQMMGGAAPTQQRPNPGATVQLSPEDAAAVARLQELGFSRLAAAQAYLACDKNEELAANYLFENPEDDMDVDNQGGAPPPPPAGGGAGSAGPNDI